MGIRESTRADMSIIYFYLIFQIDVVDEGKIWYTYPLSLFLYLPEFEVTNIGKTMSVICALGLAINVISALFPLWFSTKILYDFWKKSF